MEITELKRKCERCEKSHNNLSLLLANHKEHGWIKICKDCWVELYAANRMIAGSGSSSSVKGINSPCNSCPGCTFR